MNGVARWCLDMLYPCIQLNNLSAAIATAGELRAAPPACAMDVTRSNDQSEVPTLLYKHSEDRGMWWVGFQDHASASNRTSWSSVIFKYIVDWSKRFTSNIINMSTACLPYEPRLGRDEHTRVVRSEDSVQFIISSVPNYIKL